MSSPRNSLLSLLGITLLIRIIAIALKPESAVALDMHYWEEVVAAINSGVNPYVQTTRLNWPPLWYWILCLLNQIQIWSGLSLQLCVQIFLCLIELILVGVLFNLLSKELKVAAPDRILFWGIVLNPICLFLNVQHLNFDVLVALWCLLAVVSIVRWNGGGNPRDWSWAASFIGLGILTKTVPIALLPLLCINLDRVPRRTKLIGAALVVLPTTLALGPLLLAYPNDILQKVIQYRSAGWALIPQILATLGIQVSQILWGNIFFAVFLALLCVTCVFCRTTSVSAKQIMAIGFVLLAIIPTLGPGFGNQYLWWFLPFLVVLFALGAGPERLLIWGVFLSAVFSMAFDYLLTPEHGALLITIWPEAKIPPLGAFTALLRLPLLLALSALLWRNGRVAIYVK